jgi:hypothetical protein
MDQLLPNEYIVDLTTIGQGAAIALFAAEWRKILDNIADPNTESEARRKITLEITLAPRKDRKSSQLTIDCKAKLAPHRGEAAQIFFGIVNGRREAVESNPAQVGLFDKPDGAVLPMSAKKGE